MSEINGEETAALVHPDTEQQLVSTFISNVHTNIHPDLHDSPRLFLHDEGHHATYNKQAGTHDETEVQAAGSI